MRKRPNVTDDNQNAVSVRFESKQSPEILRKLLERTRVSEHFHFPGFIPEVDHQLLLVRVDVLQNRRLSGLPRPGKENNSIRTCFELTSYVAFYISGEVHNSIIRELRSFTT